MRLKVKIRVVLTKINIIVSDVFVSYTQKSIKTKLCSSSIATMLAKQLNNTCYKKLSQQLLHIFFELEYDGINGLFLENMLK